VETTRLTSVSNPRYEDDIDLLRYGRFLAAYWAVLAAGAVVGMVAGLAIAAALSPRYQSVATLALTPPGAPTAVVLTPASAKALLANLSIVGETLKETGLDREGVTPQSFVDDALEVQPVPSTNLVRLGVTLPDAGQAQRAADLLATKVVALTQRIDRESAVTTRRTLDEELAQAETARDAAEKELLDYQVATDVDRLEADVRDRRATASQRAELYRVRLEVERLHLHYLERARVYTDLLKRRDDLRTRREAPTQVHIVDRPIQPPAPLPRPRAQFAVFGALLGTMAAIVLALLINRRRVDRALQT